MNDTTDHIVVVTGAAPIPAAIAELIGPAAIVLGVDSGLDHARAAGLRPSGLIGDLDSVSDEGLAWAEKHATVSRHPSDKDRTDTEIALAFAAGMNPTRLTLIGGGDRLDHSIAAIAALGAPTLTGIPRLDGWWAGHHLDVVHGPGRATLSLEPASTLSLIALGRRCEKTSVGGVRWPLDQHTLEAATGIGISNEVTSNDGTVTVSLSSGVLTIFDIPQHTRDQPIGVQEDTAP